MKILFTSMLMMLMAIAHAMPVVTDSLDNGRKGKDSTPVNPASTVTMTMQQLQEENAQLRARIYEMENRFEEEKGVLQFKYTMQSLMGLIHGNSKLEKMEDLKSQVNFSKMMSNSLILIKNELSR